MRDKGTIVLSSIAGISRRHSGCFLITNSEEFAQGLDRLQQSEVGPEAEERESVQLLAECLRQELLNEAFKEEDVFQVFAVGANDERATEAEIQAAVERLHVNLGHPSREDLVRVLRSGGGAEKALEFARKFRCSTCDESKGPRVQRPAKMPGRVRPFHGVSIDVQEVAGLKPGTRRKAVWIQNEEGKTLANAFRSKWIEP